MVLSATIAKKPHGDYFDLAGLIETWARDGGENVMSVSALTLSREGVRVEVDDARGARPARRRAAAACNTTASLLVVRTLAHVMAQPYPLLLPSQDSSYQCEH